ncbi:MAG TPA: biotin/lipoyl-binding protein [Candidatus Butyricicoccus avistercoris]|uniref:Biotin/lipoyl-binding protein n=1 Tax=Candidatus Butyricicoccus avistercoris TaxID=2838518 RepID=A0A9D1PH53_9FIRM|nr:biotin/lipoyl-binding protein [Candidatus Butyricicoccus avistercoris]
MKYVVTLNGKKYEVEVEKGEATAVYAGEATNAPAPAPTQTPATPAPAQAPVQAGSGDPVTSPMPGAILDVRCSNGQQVKKGDILFILEAMKMENEIFAPKDGTITSVCTSKGATVETGSVLCTLS